MSKISPEMLKIIERMAPGVLSRGGFLGGDPRPLDEIVEADNATVVGLGVTHAELAGRLAEALALAAEALGTTVELGGGLEAVFREGMGRIPCPFGDGEIFPKGEVELTDTATGRRLLVTALSVHLIGEHGFYQGRGARYRVEPDELGRMLGT